MWAPCVPFITQCNLHVLMQGSQIPGPQTDWYLPGMRAAQQEMIVR